MFRSPCLLALALLAPIASPAYAANAQAGEEAEAEPEVVGILVGRFFVRDLRASEGTKLRISFALYAEVAETHSDASRKLIEQKKHRLRNEVITAVRTCEQSEYQAPGLERFRRRIALRLGRTHPELPIERLLVGEFEFFVD